MSQPSATTRPVQRLLPVAAALAMLTAACASSVQAERGIGDLMTPAGTRQIIRPELDRPDLWMGLDRRMPLDSVVYSLENGARTRRVLSVDSLWAVDYAWVYPHSGLPSRWYDAGSLFRVGDSLALSETTKVVVTFGTCRIGVHAGSYEQARSEAERLRPPVMPRALEGRLKLKLERARNALLGKPDVIPGDSYAK